MVQDLELCEYTTVHELGGSKGAATMRRGSEQTEQRLFRIGLCVLGLVCILQATLNITLRLALYSKEEIAEFSFNSSQIENLCQTEKLQQNSSQQCSCWKSHLKALLREHEALKRQRDLLNSGDFPGSSGDYNSVSGDYEYVLMYQDEY